MTITGITLIVKSKFRQPFGYRPRKTVLHRAPAGLKLFCVFIISIAAYISVYGLVVSVLLIFTASVAVRISPVELLRGSKPLVLLSLFIVIFKTFNTAGPGITLPEINLAGFVIPAAYIQAVNAEGFFEGVMTALRIIASFAAAALLFAVTTMRELCRSLSSVESKLRGKKGGITFFSLGLSLMLGFIPRFFELWEMSNLACEARSCKRGIRRLFIIIPQLTERMLASAADTALALEARGVNK